MPSNFIRQMRINKSISKKILAHECNISTSRITSLENGAQGTSDEYAVLALSLDAPIDELYPNQEKDWPEIEKKRKMIEIQRQIDLEELQKQAEEQERLNKELAKKRTEKEKINKKLKRISKEHEAKLREHEELTDQATKNRILRELNFPPEYQEAGITILQGFVKLIKRKYGDKDVSVTIKQTGVKVILIIKSPDGKVEEIEEFLDQYSKVVAGNQDIATLTNDPVALIELKGQLEIANLQVQQQRDINLLLKTNHDRRIESLEKENEWFKEQLALSVESSKAITEEVLRHLRGSDNQIAELANKLVSVVEKSKDTQSQLAVVGKKADTAEKTIEELNKIILKEGVGKGVAEAVRKLIKWATLHLLS